MLEHRSRAWSRISDLDQTTSSGDACTQNLVAVSFVEHLDGEPYFDRLKPM
jgi:hypothetical protein